MPDDELAWVAIAHRVGRVVVGHVFRGADPWALCRNARQPSPRVIRADEEVLPCYRCSQWLRKHAIDLEPPDGREGDAHA